MAASIPGLRREARLTLGWILSPPWGDAMNLFPTAWYRGEIVPTDSLPIQPAWEPSESRSAGVFTTTRTFRTNRRVAFWRRHQLRLFESIQIFGGDGRPYPSESELFEWMDSLNNLDVCVRINLVIGERPWAVARPLPKTPMPTRLAFSSEPASADRRLKTVGANWRRRAQQEAESQGVWDVVALDSMGLVCDASNTNLCYRVGRKWWTPQSDSLLPGVVRAALLEHGLVEERRVTVDELLAADEIVASNSVRGIVPIHEVEGRVFTPGEATKRLQEWFETAAVQHAVTET